MSISYTYEENQVYNLAFLLAYKANRHWPNRDDFASAAKVYAPCTNVRAAK